MYKLHNKEFKTKEILKSYLIEIIDNQNGEVITSGDDFELIKEAVLGKNFELSLVFCSAKKIQNLNKIYRNINKPTDILSFPLSKNSGEIFICKSEARKMMAEFDVL